MESFIISSQFEKKSFIKAHYIKWEIHWLKNKKQLIGYATASSILLVLGIIVRMDEDTFNPFLVIGILFAVATLFLYYQRYFSKKTYRKKISEIAEKFDELKMDYNYEFTDESIKYWDKEKKLEFNWSVFTYYSIYKGYLVIALNNSLIESYLFEKNESDNLEFEKVFKAVKSKLEFKEIK